MIKRIFFSCFLLGFLLLPGMSQALDCNAGMILQKSPEKPEGDCVPFRDKKVRMDITQGTSKVGKSTETYLKPQYDGSPRSIQSGYLQLWLDATDPLNDGYRPADNSTLSKWKDKSGNGHDALQDTAARQPIYTLRSINGMPSVEVTGTRAVLSPVVSYDVRQQRDLSIGGGVLNKFTDQSTVFIVYTASSDSYGAFLQSNPRNIANNFAVELIESAGNGLMTNWFFGNGGPYGGGGPGSLRIDGGTVDPTIVSLVQSAAAPSPFMHVYYRGWRVKSLATASTVSFTSADSLDIGPGFYAGNPYSLNAKIGEIIVYNKALTSAERQQIEQYLSNKWNIKLAVKAASITPVLLLDAQEPSSINYNNAPIDDDRVKIWKDLSGYGNHAGGYRTAMPVYQDGVTDPSKGINGFPALYFRGSNPADRVLIPDSDPIEYETHSAMIIWPKVMEKFSDSMTTFIIAKTPDADGQSVLSTYRNFQITIPTVETFYTGLLSVSWGIGGDSHTAVPFDAASNYGVASLWGFRSSPDSPEEGILPDKRIFRNGVIQEAVGAIAYTMAINSPMQFNQTHPLRIAAPHYTADPSPTWKGSIGEIRMYNRRLTDIEMCNCAKHLQNKWGIAPEPTACAAPSTCTAAGAGTAACFCP